VGGDTEFVLELWKAARVLRSGMMVEVSLSFGCVGDHPTVLALELNL